LKTVKLAIGVGDSKLNRSVGFGLKSSVGLRRVFISARRQSQTQSLVGQGKATNQLEERQSQSQSILIQLAMVTVGNGMTK
jgi:hypothetical protein